jgi:hypothetical protein
MRYEITKEQLETILEACKPVPYIVVGGVPPESPQERANRAWKRLGDELGFHFMTVRPIPGQPQTVFEAVPKEAN